MKDMQKYIDKVLKHYYKKIAKSKKELKEAEEIIEVFEKIKGGEYFDRL